MGSRRGLGPAQGERSERRLALAVQRRRSGTESARRRARSGTRRAAPERSARRNGSRHELECSRAVRAGVQAERSAAARAGPRVLGPRARRPDPLGASPRFRAAGGHAALPSATQEREPRPAVEPPRRADPPRSFWRRLRRGGSRWAQRGPRRSDQGGHDSRSGSAADGPRDVPARVLQERRVRARCFAHTPPPAGLHSTGRSAAEEEADDVTAARRWRGVCRLDH